MKQYINIRRSFSLLAVVACLCAGGGYKAQAQLYLDIFPSRDSTNQTLWVFSGSSTAWAHPNAGPHIRTSGGFDQHDSDKTTSAFLRNTPQALYALTPLFTATATNAPMLTFGSSRRSIANMLLNDVARTGWDDIGPRVDAPPEATSATAATAITVLQPSVGVAPP